MHGPPAVCRPWLSLDHPHLPIRTPPAVGHSDGWCRVWTAAHPTTYAPPLVARYVGSRPTMLHASIFLLTPMFPASVVRRRQIAGSLTNLYYPPSNRGPGLVFFSTLINAGGRLVCALVQAFVLHKYTTNANHQGSTWTGVKRYCGHLTKRITRNNYARLGIIHDTHK